MAGKNVIEVQSTDFQEIVLNSNVPVLVDLWAAWCAPCLALTPIFEQLASQFEGKAKFVKLNVDECPDIAGRYRIMNIPTMLLFKDGEVEATKVGAVSKSQLTAFIDSNI